MGLSYKENYISGSGFSNSFFTKVFCSWDYAVTQQSSASLHSKSIYNDLMVCILCYKGRFSKTILSSNFDWHCGSKLLVIADKGNARNQSSISKKVQKRALKPVGQTAAFRTEKVIFRSSHEFARKEGGYI